MPKTLLEKIVFTIVMAAIMVYGMIVYNVALNTGGVTNATFMQPTDRPQFITYAISLMIVCIMCPIMSLVATVLFKEPSFGMWVHTFGCNFPVALCWQMFYCGPLSRAIFRLMFRRGEKR